MPHQYTRTGGPIVICSGGHAGGGSPFELPPSSGKQVCHKNWFFHQNITQSPRDFAYPPKPDRAAKLKRDGGEIGADFKRKSWNIFTKFLTFLGGSSRGYNPQNQPYLMRYGDGVSTSKKHFFESYPGKKCHRPDF